jgi:diketogulonate reductase-like aldo/keto reductase
MYWRGSYTLEETVAGFEILRQTRKILSWAVSNFDVDDLEELWSIVGPGRIACNQVLYHLKERSIEHQLILWCVNHGVAIVGYSPFGHSSWFPSPHTIGGRVLASIATTHDAAAQQAALAFLVRRASLFTIPKASSPERAEENAGGGDLQLSEQELSLIDGTFPLSIRRRLPTL